MKKALFTFLLCLTGSVVFAQTCYRIEQEEQDGRKIYYFTDADGQAIERMGRWDNAEHFSRCRDLAKVQRLEKDTLVDYLVDTSGLVLKVVYRMEDWSPSVQALDLSNQKLSAIPKELLQSGNDLRFLWLTNNNIERLPPEIGLLDKLVYLSLFKNKLSSLPAEIGSWRQLRYLSLWGNQLKDLPKEMGAFKQLAVLDLGSNQLSELPSELGQMKLLNWLSLSQNRLQALPKEIGYLAYLDVLYVTRNKLDRLPKEFTVLKYCRS